MNKFTFLVILFFSQLSWTSETNVTDSTFKSMSTASAIQHCTSNGQRSLFQLAAQDSLNISSFLNNFNSERKTIILNTVMKKAQKMSNNCDEMSDNAVRIFNAITKTHDQIEEALGIELFD